MKPAPKLNPTAWISDHPETLAILKPWQPIIYIGPAWSLYRNYGPTISMVDVAKEDFTRALRLACKINNTHPKNIDRVDFHRRAILSSLNHHPHPCIKKWTSSTWRLLY